MFAKTPSLFDGAELWACGDDDDEDEDAADSVSRRACSALLSAATEVLIIAALAEEEPLQAKNSSSASSASLFSAISSAGMLKERARGSSGWIGIYDEVDRNEGGGEIGTPADDAASS